MQLTNRYYWVIACTLFLFPLKSQASAWVSTQSRVNDQYIGGFSWPTEEDNTTRLCNATACSVAICHFSSNLAELCANPSYALSRVIVPNGATAKEMRDIFVAQNGVSGIWSTVTKSLQAADTCFGIMYWQGINNINFTGRPIPGSYCGNLPPATETCDITGDVNIDYGPINQQGVEGAIKSAPLHITCTAKTLLKLTLVGNARIDLGQNGTLTSTLTLLQQNLSNGVSVTSEVGENTFILESKLHTTGSPVVGIFNGSGVIIMSYF